MHREISQGPSTGQGVGSFRRATAQSELRPPARRACDSPSAYGNMQPGADRNEQDKHPSLPMSCPQTWP